MVVVLTRCPYVFKMGPDYWKLLILSFILSLNSGVEDICRKKQHHG